MSAIRVIIADDHPVFLAGLQALLDSMPGLEVVGSASGGRELLDLAERSQFDVAVLDLDMPGVDGAIATESILRIRPDAGILILTMHDDSGSLRRCLQAGARGYILKGSGHGAIGRAVAAVADGDTVITGDLGRSVRAAVSSGALAPNDGLTARERDILELVQRGLDNPDIARRLSLSVKTVQNNVSSLLTKRQASSRAALVAQAHQAQRKSRP